MVARYRPPTRERPRALLAGLAGMLAVAAASSLLTAAVLEIQGAGTAYIAGEGQWSKAQQEATAALYRYAMASDPADLAAARDALAVPLGDLEARRAMERSPIDLARAERGFLAGRNAPEDVGRMIWLFRWFADAPYFREAVALWREADAPILRVAAIARELEQLPADAGEPRAALARELLVLDRELRVLEQGFSATLVDGVRWLRGLLQLAALGVFLVLALLSALLVMVSLRRIRASEQRYRALFEQAGIGMAEVDGEGRVLRANRALLATGGWSPGQLEGEALDELLLPGEHADERRLPRGDGSVRWVRLKRTRIHPGNGDPELDLALVEDISEARRKAREIAHRAEHDALTGLANRGAFLARLADAVAEAREGRGVHALCFVDVDRFKEVNDGHGHAAGDALLAQLGRRLCDAIRPGDLAGRLGGDEFAVLLRDVDAAGARVAATRLREAIVGEGFTWESRRFRLTASLGAVLLDCGTRDVAAALAAADRACYAVKDGGRDGVLVVEGPGEA